MTALEDLVDIITPKAVRVANNDDFVEESTAIVRPKDFPNGGFLSAVSSEIEMTKALSDVTTILPNDVLIDSVSCKVTIVGDIQYPCIASRELLILRSKKERKSELASFTLTSFIYMFLRSEAGQKALLQCKKTIRIIRQDLCQLQIPLGEFDVHKVQVKFQEEVELYQKLATLKNPFDNHKTLCVFCQQNIATKRVHRWDTWTNRQWEEPACVACAHIHKQTWLT